MIDSFAQWALTPAFLGSLACGQCTQEWMAANTYPGTNGLVRALARWDPDGAGPLTERIAVGGYFSAAGGTSAANVAAFDPTTGTWSALGTGLTGTQSTGVCALLALPNGELLAAGEFSAGSLWYPGVAYWTGGGWLPLGSLTGATSIRVGPVGAALAVRPNGEIFAAGTGGVARWTGTAWLEMSTDWYGVVRALTVLPNGDVIAGGSFATIGGTAATNIARWDGATWHPLGNGLSTTVSSLSARANGNVIATSSTPSGVHEWNGATWTSLGGGFTSEVLSSAVLGNGDVVVGGLFHLPATRIARWNGATWSAMGTGADNSVAALLVLPSGDLLAGGNFRHVDGAGRSFVARWNGGWSALGPGIDEFVRDFEVLPNGDVVAGGDFTHAGTVDARRIARWSGGAWQTLGTGVDGTVPSVFAVEVLANGDVVAGGSFETAGGAPAPQLARFDGSQWHAMGTSTGPGTVRTLLQLPNGELLVGGNFRLNGNVTFLARWTATGWAPVPASPNGVVHAAILLANGDLLISGAFTAVGATPANGIARGDGTTWTALGAGLAGPVVQVPCLAEMRDGAIVAGGVFTTAGGAPITVIAQWNGAQWLTLGPSQPFAYVRGFARLPDGDLAVGGAFGGFPTPAHIARWDGSSWSVLGAMQGSVTGGLISSPDFVQAMAILPWGDLAVSGWFLGAGAIVSPYLAVLRPTCRATAVSYGGGCVGSGGLNVLEATTLPWLESTFRARATGLATNALVVAVWAFQQLQLPMQSVHPQGQPGCTLLLADHILIDFANRNGTASTAIAIPNDPALVGTDFFHQVVAVELGAGMAITAITSTNGLTATAGVW